MMENGRMVNNMELELSHLKINKLKKESGSTAKKLDGLIEKLKNKNKLN
jgi:hypothetical protein